MDKKNIEKKFFPAVTAKRKTIHSHFSHTPVNERSL